MQTNSREIIAAPMITKAALPLLMVLLAASALMLLVLRQFPQIDLAFGDLFFDASLCADPAEGIRCGTFPLAGRAGWVIARDVGHALPLLLMTAVCLHLTWLLMFNANKGLQQLYPPFIAILSALAGPLIVVNLLLKEYWGRPRPVETVFFGGEHPYVPPGDISTYCDTNCSFVSGEASAAFWMLTLAFYFGAKQRGAFIVLAGIPALAIGFLRIAFGRHYLSDVIMAGCIMAIATVFAIWLLQSQIVAGWITSLHRFSNRHALGRRYLKN